MKRMQISMEVAAVPLSAFKEVSRQINLPPWDLLSVSSSVFEHSHAADNEGA